jgi:photosystem II stability/assembly factor-like uncharacterized protein
VRRRALLALVAVAAAGCGPGHRLTVHVSVSAYDASAGTRVTHRYVLRCGPPGGSMPDAAQLCRDIAVHPRPMLAPGRARSVCAGSPNAPTITVVSPKGRLAGEPACDWPGGTALALYWAAAQAREPLLARFEARLRCDDDRTLLAKPTPWRSVYACTHGLWTPRTAKLIAAAEQSPPIAALAARTIFPAQIGARQCLLNAVRGDCEVNVTRLWSRPRVSFTESWGDPAHTQRHTWVFAVAGGRPSLEREAGPVPPQLWKTAAAGARPPGLEPVSFTAISSREFWLLGRTALLRTTDGGRTFARLASPPAAVDTVRFATPLDGFAFDSQSLAAQAGAAVWGTIDGGAHWRPLGVPGVHGFATGGGLVYLVTGGCSAGVCDGLGLRRAPLGTDDWSVAPLPIGRAEPPAALAVHGRAVWISLSPTQGAGPKQVLLASADAGSTFTTLESPCSRGLGGDLEASSADVVWAVCPTGMLAAALRSADGGRTWSQLAVGRELVNAARVAPADDETAVVATGDGTQLLRTTDGGRTFAQAYPRRPGAWTFIGFTDARTGSGIRLAADGRSTELVRSTDGGARWRALATGPEATPIPGALAFRTPLAGLAGTPSTISSTRDGGRTWTVELRTPQPVVAVWYAGATAWARYDDGMTVASTDGGRDWHVATAGLLRSPCPSSDITQPVEPVVRTAGGNEWALCVDEPGAGNQGKAVYRLIAGRWRRIAWTSFPGPRAGSHGGISSYGYPRGIAMADDGFGLVWESRGTLYVTRDGGSQWTPLPKVARPEVDFGAAGAVLDGGHGYVVLTNWRTRARLLRTDDAGRTWRVVHTWS